jgi:hypothetical protein
MQQDLDQIKILSIFHYVVAGIAALFACFPILHLAMGIMFLTGSFFPPNSQVETGFPMTLFGLVFTVIPAGIIFFGWAFAIVLAIAGYFLGRNQRYMFCMIMAGVATLFTPFGTALGVFTLIVLTRPSVRALFEGTPPASLTAPPPAPDETGKS